MVSLSAVSARTRRSASLAASACTLARPSFSRSSSFSTLQGTRHSTSSWGAPSNSRENARSRKVRWLRRTFVSTTTNTLTQSGRGGAGRGGEREREMVGELVVMPGQRHAGTPIPLSQPINHQ